MAHPLTFEEIAEGKEGYEASRRARAILLSSSGYTADHIGLIIPMHANHVRKWIKGFNELGGKPSTSTIRRILQKGGYAGGRQAFPYLLRP